MRRPPGIPPSCSVAAECWCGPRSACLRALLRSGHPRPTSSSGPLSNPQWRPPRDRAVLGVIRRLEGLWRAAASPARVTATGRSRRCGGLCGHATHVFSPQPLRERLEQGTPVVLDSGGPSGITSVLRVEHRARCRALVHPWPCRAGGHGVEAVSGSSRRRRSTEKHFLDGASINSVPVGRAVELPNLQDVYVLQVGRVERPLSVPEGPIEVARVSFEIARRRRFPAARWPGCPRGCTWVLPSGAGSSRDDLHGLPQFRCRRTPDHRLVCREPRLSRRPTPRGR